MSSFGGPIEAVEIIERAIDSYKEKFGEKDGEKDGD